MRTKSNSLSASPVLPRASEVFVLPVPPPEVYILPVPQEVYFLSLSPKRHSFLDLLHAVLVRLWCWRLFCGDRTQNRKETDRKSIDSHRYLKPNWYRLLLRQSITIKLIKLIDSQTSRSFNNFNSIGNPGCQTVLHDEILSQLW